MNFVKISHEDKACILDNKKSVPPILIKPAKPFREFLSKKLSIPIKSVEAGLIEGDLEGYTHPNSFITREEAVVILGRAFHIAKNNNISITSCY